MLGARPGDPARGGLRQAPAAGVCQVQQAPRRVQVTRGGGEAAPSEMLCGRRFEVWARTHLLRAAQRFTGEAREDPEALKGAARGVPRARGKTLHLVATHLPIPSSRCCCVVNSLSSSNLNSHQGDQSFPRWRGILRGCCMPATMRRRSLGSSGWLLITALHLKICHQPLSCRSQGWPPSNLRRIRTHVMPAAMESSTTTMREPLHCRRRPLPSSPRPRCYS